MSDVRFSWTDTGSLDCEQRVRVGKLGVKDKNSGAADPLAHLGHASN